MSDDKANLTRLKDAYESFNSEGVRALESMLAPALEWLESPLAMKHVHSRREDAVARMDELGWDEWWWEPEDFLEFDDRVVVPVRQTRRVPREDAKSERQRAHYWRMGSEGAERLEVHVKRADAVNAAVGYFALLERIHERLRPRTYVEIGVHLGRSLGRVRADTTSLGIDPEPIISDPAVEQASKVFRTTSDDFFRDHDLRAELGGLPLDLAFIDGMHLFEYVLRDFANLERYCTPQSVILVHDCYPAKREHADREWKTVAWCGDVWKIIPCLREQRPDLNLSAIDIRPAGMGVITGLDPDSMLLSESYDEIVERYMSFDYDWVEEAKEERLARIEHDWNLIEALLPPPFDEHAAAALGEPRA